MIGRGERAMDFVARRGDGRQTRFYGAVGGTPAVLVFSGAGGEAEAIRVRERLRAEVGAELDVHVVAGGAAVTEADTFHDAQGSVHGAYGVPLDGRPVVVVLDPNVRVTATRVMGDIDAALESEEPWAQVAVAVRAASLDGPGTTASRHAPVLFVPDALDAGTCAQLQELWAAAGNEPTGVEATIGGTRVDAGDAQRKRRRDHTVTDPQVLSRLSGHIGRRVMPEIRKAFAYEARRFEGFKIGSYDAGDRGFFTAHRDNLSPSTAHRKFALSLNLNDDYDGGELRFPEYGPDRYRPAPGEALVFSGAHLHEVLPVTRGRRFVLLSFLFGDEAVRR